MNPDELEGRLKAVQIVSFQLLQCVEVIRPALAAAARRNLVGHADDLEVSPAPADHFCAALLRLVAAPAPSQSRTAAENQRALRDLLDRVKRDDGKPPPEGQ